MERLLMIIHKYYDAHQISRSVNILEIAKMAKPDDSIKPFKCICNFLEPPEGWNKGVQASASPEEKCYHCSMQLKSAFPDYKENKGAVLPPSVDNRQCQYCYWFCTKKYVSEGSPLRLAKKFIKKGKMRL